MRILIIAFISIAFFSCEKTVVLDLEQTSPKIVIEGLVTDSLGRQSVKVTRSTDFYAAGKAPRVTNAMVTVEDSEGNIYPFVQSLNPDSAGIYIPQTPFAGVIGRNYKLSVAVDGQEYTAEDMLLKVLLVDSVTYRINDQQKEDPRKSGKIYELLMYTKEPQETEDYYLFKFYRNDSLTFFNDSDIYYTNDELLAENIQGFPSPVYYALQDTAVVEVYQFGRKTNHKPINHAVKCAHK